EIRFQQERKTIYSEGSGYEDNQHPYISDLDVFGPYSLYTLLNRCATLLGNNLLSNWLLKASEKAEIDARQNAVDELPEDVVCSQKFQAELLFNLDQKVEIKSFLARYYKDSAFSFGSKALYYYVLCSPIIFL